MGMHQPDPPRDLTPTDTEQLGTISTSDIFSKDEIRELTTASDLQGAFSVLLTWSLIALCFAMVMWSSHPLVILLALILLGNRQLALAVLMHECAHRSLFATRSWNRPVGHWLCGAPTWSRVDAYREHHLKHHNYTGTERDPDRSLVTPFPTSPSSLARKLLRDLSGISGVRRAVGLLSMDVGLIEYTDAPEYHRTDLRGRTMADYVGDALRNFGPTLLANVVLAAVLTLVASPWLYLLWVGAWLTTYGFFLRIRAIAEHACTEWTPNRLENTRTTTRTLSRAYSLPRIT